MAQPRLAIDAMSGDFGPRVIVPATIDYLSDDDGLAVTLIGDEQLLNPLVPPKYRHRVSIIHTTEVIAMDEPLASCLRGKKQSSMRLAILEVAEGRAGACISAGNTAALMALGKLLLKTIDGVSRPAICGAVPSLNSHSYLLDMGANVDCDAEHLLQFALMARVLVSCLDKRQNPSVALLNNGEEEIKGNTQVKHAAELLSEHPDINYIGYLEGHKIYEAAADIIVCDGFVGNVVLKASEGVATFIIDKTRQEFRRDRILQLLGFFALPGLLRMKNKIDPRRFNGASLLGLRGNVVKSHGHADEFAFYSALKQAASLSISDLPGQLDKAFTESTQPHV